MNEGFRTWWKDQKMVYEYMQITEDAALDSWEARQPEIDALEAKVAELETKLKEVAEQKPLAWYDPKYKDFSNVNRIGWIPLGIIPTEDVCKK